VIRHASMHARITAGLSAGNTESSRKGLHSATAKVHKAGRVHCPDKANIFQEIVTLDSMSHSVLALEIESACLIF